MENVRSKLVEGIIVLFVAIILIGAIAMIYNGMKSTSLNTKCKRSVDAYAKLIELNVPAKEASIECPANKVKLSGTEDEMKKQIAEEMRTCWNNYGEGKKRLFRGKGTFCSVCAIINTDSDTSVTSFPAYLTKTYVPGEEYTYLEYIADFKTENAQDAVDEYNNAVSRANANDNLNFKKGENYAVIYVHINDYDTFKNFVNFAKVSATGISIGAVGGALAGAGVAVVWTGAGTIPGIGLIAAGAVTWTFGTVYAVVENYFNSLDFDHYSEVLLRSYNSNTLKDELKCDYIPVQVIE